MINGINSDNKLLFNRIRFKAIISGYLRTVRNLASFNSIFDHTSMGICHRIKLNSLDEFLNLWFKSQNIGQKFTDRLLLLFIAHECVCASAQEFKWFQILLWNGFVKYFSWFLRMSKHSTKMVRTRSCVAGWIWCGIWRQIGATRILIAVLTWLHKLTVTKLTDRRKTKTKICMSIVCIVHVNSWNDIVSPLSAKLVPRLAPLQMEISLSV